MSKGLLIVASGPSGVGKGTINRMMMERLSGIEYSISVTTRSPRGGEVNGKDYFFVNKSTFFNMMNEDKLLEYAEVFGNYYGTPREYVEGELAAGRDVLLEIDVQGALQIKEKIPEAVTVFFSPPNMDELEKRLRGRATEEDDVVIRRLMDAAWELSQQNKYDYVLINDELNRGVDKYIEIIKKEREKRK
ncbi:MAG: guanylate kinase [Acidaminococcaceae bacterium]|nr:guanylate kinase [Acidaminococcaceae bacterium]